MPVYGCRGHALGEPLSEVWMQVLVQFLTTAVWTLVGASVGLAVGCAGMILAFFVLFIVSGPLVVALQAIAPAAIAEPAASVGLGAFCLLMVWYVAGAGAIAAVRAYRVPSMLLSILMVAVVLGTWSAWVRTELLSPAPTPGEVSPPPPAFPALLDAMPAAAALGLWLSGRRGSGRMPEEADMDAEGEPDRT